MTEHLKNLFDWIAGVFAAGVVMKFLPFLLAIPSAIWSCIRIYEWYKGRTVKD